MCARHCGVVSKDWSEGRGNECSTQASNCALPVHGSLYCPKLNATQPDAWHVHSIAVLGAGRALHYD